MKQGNIYYTDKDFTDLEVLTTFKYPCMLILKNAENEIVKITTYDEFGNKSISKFDFDTLDTVTEKGNTTANEITVGGITTNYVQLDTTSVNTYNIGKVYWNETKGTYNFGLKNNVELQLGQEQHVYGKAYSAISNGQLVMYRTSQGGHILFEPADFTQLSTNPDLIIGIATQDIALNDFGYITPFGEVNTLNTSSFSDGNTLYFGSGNVLQNTVPSGSYFIVGRVNRSHATQGIIFVKPYFVDSTKISGSGTANYISKFSATGTITNSIIYETNNKIGVNTTPSDTLDIKTVRQGSIRFGGANGRTISAYNSTGTLMNIDFASGATFLGNLYGSNIFDFATNKQSVRLSSTNITFWSNSLQRLTLDIDGNFGVGKIPNEKLDIAGRTKSDGIVINETTSAILPKEIKFKNGKFKAALADGVEKAILLEGDASSDDKFVKEVVYNGRQEIYLSSFNYATGRGTTTVPHGLPIGSSWQSSAVPNSFKTLHNDHSKYPSLITDLKAIPYEFYTLMKDIYIVDANTIEIRNSGGAAIIVNTTSTQNNGNMQTSNFSWHIEVKPSGGFINIDGLPTNLKNFRIECLMLGDYADSSGSEYRRLFFKRYDENNISQSIPSLGGWPYSDIGPGYLGNYNWDRLSFGFSVGHNIYARTLIDVHCNSNLMTVYINEKRYGRGTAAFATTEVKFNNLLDIPMPNNNGISEIKLTYGDNFRLANGTVFKIYKY